MKKQYTYIAEYTCTNWDKIQTIEHEIFKSNLNSLDVISVITEWLMMSDYVSNIHIIPLEGLRITEI